MKRCGIALIGWGTVGTGVTRLLLGKRQELARRTGADLELRWVVDTDLERPREFPVPKNC